MITGEMVKLRAIEPADICQLWEWMQDEETMRFRDFPAPPSSLKETEAEYQKSIGKRLENLRLAITTMDDELIGEIALRNIDQRAGTADFVIAIGNKAYWGHGYGTDATRSLMTYAFSQLNLHRITLFVHAFNSRAIRAYEKVGFKNEGCMRQSQYMDGGYSDVLVMGLLRDELFVESSGRKFDAAA